jgi:hypothetical protein
VCSTVAPNGAIAVRGAARAGFRIADTRDTARVLTKIRFAVRILATFEPRRTAELAIRTAAILVRFRLVRAAVHARERFANSLKRVTCGRTIHVEIARVAGTARRTRSTAAIDGCFRRIQDVVVAGIGGAAAAPQPRRATSTGSRASGAGAPTGWLGLASRSRARFSAVLVRSVECKIRPAARYGNGGYAERAYPSSTGAPHWARRFYHRERQR